MTTVRALAGLRERHPGACIAWKTKPNEPPADGRRKKMASISNMPRPSSAEPGGPPARPWAAASDEDLMLAYQKTGDAEAFAELVRRYEKELYSYLRRYLGDASLAEDAFQATFLQVHTKCHQFEAGRKVRPWLYAIAMHQAVDALRRVKRQRMVSLDQPNAGPDTEGELTTLLAMLDGEELSPELRLEADERRRWVRAAVDALPDVLRSAVVLVYYQGLKYKEAAEILNIPVGTIKSRLHAALLKLHQAWKEAHREGEP
jgi:RNA polymerase sigma-70 factor (ECF subfamily)